MSTLPSNIGADIPSPYVKEITVQNFMQEVIQTSLQVPVLVYFTATWCGPCKQFGPLLEKVVNEAKGKVRLARVDVDKNPQLAQQFRIQSVPMVYVFSQGQPLDGFSGALPESQIKALIEQVAGAGPEDEMMKATLESATELLAQGDTAKAAQIFGSLVAEDKNNIEAVAGFAKTQVALGQLEEAEQLLSEVPQDKQTVESIVAAKAALTLAKSAPKAANLDALHKALAANPKDHAARLELAQALFAAGKHTQAVEELLTSIRQDRNWNEGAARAQLLTFFEALGFGNSIAAQGRRKLSSILFS